MDSLIPIINQLQDVCNTCSISLPIDLPQIVVVGSQSSGKSSVIESIVRREFLPRGEGIVTRRPLVIRLFKISDTDRGDWARFGHLDREFTDFDEVREEIERETERACTTKKGICREPITVNVYSKNVVDLTLVDLPGLVRNRLDDQPEDIEMQIRDLAASYISNPNSIILAVTAASNDLVTCEGIRLVREVDPEGKRTLCVLTKLDIMYRGQHALNVLQGKVIRIQLGIIGVVNRSQQDIENKKPIEKAIEDESKFFQQHYPTIAKKHGQPYLAKKLSKLLMRHIRDCLPDLKDRVNSLISQYQAQLNSYGDPITDKAQTILNIITNFASTYCNTIMGGKRRVNHARLSGGARILWIFYSSFNQALDCIKPLETLDKKAILLTARNEAGVRTAIRVPDVFELLVRDQIERLKAPSLRCVELVHEEMGKFVLHSGDEVQLELLRFPKLRARIEEILTKLLAERLPATQEMIVNLITIATAHINTEHPQLREVHNITHQEPMRINGTMSNGNTTIMTDETYLRSEREKLECEDIARNVDVYFKIVKEKFKMDVPGAIMGFMVNHITTNLQTALIKEIYHQRDFDELLSESDDIAQRRKQTAEMLSALRKAGEIINTINDQK